MAVAGAARGLGLDAVLGHPGPVGVDHALVELHAALRSAVGGWRTNGVDATYWSRRTEGGYAVSGSLRLSWREGGSFDFHSKSCATMLALSICKVSFEYLEVPYLLRNVSNGILSLLRDTDCTHKKYPHGAMISQRWTRWFSTLSFS